MAASVLEKSRRLRTVRFLPEYLPESQREHRRLLEAIEQRDAAAAERLTRQHIEHAGRLLWKFAVERVAPAPGDRPAPQRRIARLKAHGTR
jgi:DNA-binding GntR family transcriptional regulator